MNAKNITKTYHVLTSKVVAKHVKVEASSPQEAYDKVNAMNKVQLKKRGWHDTTHPKQTIAVSNGKRWFWVNTDCEECEDDIHQAISIGMSMPLTLLDGGKS